MLADSSGSLNGVVTSGAVGGVLLAEVLEAEVVGVAVDGDVDGAAVVVDVCPVVLLVLVVFGATVCALGPLIVPLEPWPGLDTMSVLVVGKLGASRAVDRVTRAKSKSIDVGGNIFACTCSK